MSDPTTWGISKCCDAPAYPIDGNWENGYICSECGEECEIEEEAMTKREALHMAICILPESMFEQKDELHRIVREHDALKEWKARVIAVAQLTRPLGVIIVNGKRISIWEAIDDLAAGEEK